MPETPTPQSDRSADAQPWMYFKTRSGNVYEIQPSNEPGQCLLRDMRSGGPAEIGMVLQLEVGERARIATNHAIVETSLVTKLEITDKRPGIEPGRVEAEFLESTDRPLDLAAIHEARSPIYFKTKSGNIYEVRPTPEPDQWLIADVRSGRPAETVIITRLERGDSAHFVSDAHLISTSRITELEVAELQPGRTATALEREYFTELGKARIARNSEGRTGPGRPQGFALGD